MVMNFRCSKCNRLLGKIEGKAEIKCPKCKTTNQLDSDTYPWGEGIVEKLVPFQIGDESDKDWFENLPDGCCSVERLTVDEVKKRYPTK